MVKLTIKRIFCITAALIMMLGCVILPAVAMEGVDECAPAGYVNVAEGAAVSVSKASSKTSGENSYEMASENWCKAMLVDGKMNTGWSTNPYDVETDKTKPVTLTLDLGEATEICRVVLFPTGSGNNFPVTYTVSVSLDNQAYTEVVRSEGNPGVNKNPGVHDFAPTKARYVKIHVTERYAVESAGAAQSSDGLLVQLAEVAVYGKSIQKIALNKHALKLVVGESAQLSMQFSGFESNPAVTWKSAGPS